MSCEYDRDYFENGIETGKSCYMNYRWLPDSALQACRTVMVRCGINQDDLLLDFGCAKGFYTKAFRILGVLAFGVDISEYAINSTGFSFIYQITDVHDIERPSEKSRYDWLFAKDVLEHINESELDEVLETLSMLCKNAFIVVPLGDENGYYAPSNAADITHKICRPMAWWEDVLGEHWLHIDASYHFPVLKDRFNEPLAHGFFTCTRR